MIDFYFKLPDKPKRRFVVAVDHCTVSRFVKNILYFYLNNSLKGKDVELYIRLDEKRKDY